MKESDIKYMQRAIQLGEKGRMTAPPNPWVGAVIVKDDCILGEGFHRAAGEPHAETVALQAAGGDVQGATLYVTLEPCSHHGRTPPCVDAVIKAKFNRVVIALEDPDPKVNGQGIAKLKEAGILVEVGVAHAEAERSLAPYLHHRRIGRPYCLAKAAISIDGRIAAADGSSQWISSEEARMDAQRIRAESQAILIGSGTALKDHPKLTVRNNTFVRPLRVLLDATGKVKPEGPLFDCELAPTLVFTSAECSPETLRAWKKAGAEIEIVSMRNGRLDILEVLEILGKRKIIQVLVEGGSAILSSFLQEDLIDRLVLYVGACILGDQGLPLFKDIGCHSIKDALRLKLRSAVLVGDTVKIEYDRKL